MSASTSLNEKTRVARMCDQWFDDDMFFKISFGIAVNGLGNRTISSTTGFIVLAAAPRTGETLSEVFDHVPPGGFQSLVIGRHNRADFAIRSDNSLSLRHAMVILKKDHEENAFVRILDLRSIFGVHDKAKETHLSLASDGPIALRLADTALFVLPIKALLAQGISDVKESSFDTVEWPAITPYLPESEPEQHIRNVSLTLSGNTAVSVITQLTGETASNKATDKSAGILHFRVGERAYNHAVDPYALRAGLLIGRYDRCDISEKHFEMHSHVSRVHALLLSIDGRVHLFDTGSSNGLYIEDTPVTQIALSSSAATAIMFGSKMEMTWKPIGR